MKPSCNLSRGFILTQFDIGDAPSAWKALKIFYLAENQSRYRNLTRRRPGKAVNERFGSVCQSMSGEGQHLQDPVLLGALRTS